MTKLAGTDRSVELRRVVDARACVPMADGVTYYGPVWGDGSLAFVLYQNEAHEVEWAVDRGQWMRTR